MSKPVTLETVARLHQSTTLFHVFIYFAPEVAGEYRKVGMEGRTGYFGSRAAAMGAVPAEVVISTFYNFAPGVVRRAMDGLWATTTPQQAQAARWAAAGAILNEHVRPVMSDEAVEEATAILQTAVDNLSWPGRPLAAGNAAVLADCPADNLVYLWQLATVVREWRGDTHIALLVAEPLDGTECTVITHALKGGKGFTKAARAWPDDQWDTAVARLIQQGWISAEDTLTEDGRVRRARVEDRTDELSARIWSGQDDETINRLGDLLQPGVDALTAAGHLAPVGFPAPAD